MVTYVTLATSMGGGVMAIGGVTYVTRNIYGGGGPCRDMQSDVHCLRFSAVPSGGCFASRGLPDKNRFETKSLILKNAVILGSQRNPKNKLPKIYCFLIGKSTIPRGGPLPSK